MSSETRRLLEKAEAEGRRVELPGPLVVVPREYVEDASKRADFLPKVRAFLGQSKVPEGSAFFCFEGYDHDPRELFQIGEVCRFLFELFKVEPTLLRKFEDSQRHIVRLAMSDQIHVVPVSSKLQWQGATSTAAWEAMASAAGIDAEDCRTLTPRPAGPR